MNVTKVSEGIGSYAAKLIGNRARQLLGRHGFTECDREDLEQEMICDLLGRLPKYNRRKATLQTFIAYVVNHKIALMLESRYAARRDYRKRIVSLNAPVNNDEGRKTQRIERVDQEDYLRRTANKSLCTDALNDLRIDLELVIDKFPKALGRGLCPRSLCARLLTQSVTEISRETGEPRWRIYESIQKIRPFFKNAGLDEY